MSTNNSPAFPLPTTSTGPRQYVAGNPEQHPRGSSQGYAYPQAYPPSPPETRNSRSNSGFVPPSNVPRPHRSAHASGGPHYQPTHGPVGNLTIPIPQVQETPVPSTASSGPRLMVPRGETMMHMPTHLNNIQPAPVPHLNHPLVQEPVSSYSPSQRGGMPGDEHMSAYVQRYQNEGNDGGYSSGQGPSSFQCTDTRPKGPPDKPASVHVQESEPAHDPPPKSCCCC
ncbi:hypothetical protein V8E53_006008 [Lactarius tabidus]